MIVEQFIQWLTTAGPEQRMAAAGPMVRAYLTAPLSAEERDGLEAVMTVYLDDADPAVRAALALALATEASVPHPVVLALAQDVDEIAAEVIAHSPVLLEAELVDIVAIGSEPVQLAAARRAAVGPGLSAALAEVGEASAVAALLRNSRAVIPLFSLRRIVERLGSDAEVRAAVLGRAGVPIDVRQSLLLEMSAAYQDLILAQSDMREDLAEVVTREAKDKATIALAAQAADDEMRPLVEHLRATGQLTTTLMLRAACVGNIAFIREALSLLSGMPARRIMVLIADGREAAVRALYRKAGMPDRAYPVFRAAIEVNRELAGVSGLEDQRFPRLVIDRVIERIPPGPEADDLVVMLRRFATEAARDAARHYVARSLARPAALAAPPVEHAREAEPTGVDGEEAAFAVPAAVECIGEAWTETEAWEAIDVAEVPAAFETADPRTDAAADPIEADRDDVEALYGEAIAATVRAAAPAHDVARLGDASAMAAEPCDFTFEDFVAAAADRPVRIAPGPAANAAEALARAA